MDTLGHWTNVNYMTAVAKACERHRKSADDGLEDDAIRLSCIAHVAPVQTRPGAINS